MCVCVRERKSIYIGNFKMMSNIAPFIMSTTAEAEQDDTPVTLGFGIPAPPPSYKTAIAKQNSETFLVSCHKLLVRNMTIS